MESLFYLFHRRHAYVCWKSAIQSQSHALKRYSRFACKVYDLAKCVHTCIGSASAIDTDILSREVGDSSFDFKLDASLANLELEP